MPDLVVVNIRNVPVETRERALRAAAARNMTLAEYLTALAQLHDAMRVLADSGHEQVRAELEGLGLNTVSA